MERLSVLHRAERSRAFEVVVAALGGVVGGVLAAAASRVAMRVVYLAQPETAGVIVAERFAVGEVTVAGTLAILMAGAVAGGPVGLLYAVARPVLSAHAVQRRMQFAGLTVALLAWPELRFEDLDFRLFDDPAWLPPLLFAGVLLLFGGSTAWAADRLGARPAYRPGPAARRVGHVALLAVAAAGLVAASVRLAAG